MLTTQSQFNRQELTLGSVFLENIHQNNNSGFSCFKTLFPSQYIALKQYFIYYRKYAQILRLKELLHLKQLKS